MTLADRCDEIVRLIDETLVSVGEDADLDACIDAHPSGADLVGRRTGRAPVVAGGRRRGPPHTIT